MISRLCLLLLLGPTTALRAAAVWTPDDFTIVSTPASPRVAYAVGQGAAGLDFAVEVEPFDENGTGIKVSAGAAAAKLVTL